MGLRTGCAEGRQGQATAQRKPQRRAPLRNPQHVARKRHRTRAVLRIDQDQCRAPQTDLVIELHIAGVDGMDEQERLLPKEFRPVYRYKFINGNVVAGEVLDDELWKQRGVVYARHCDGDIVYVGKADGTLRRRITRHLNGFPSDPKTKPYREYAEGKTVTIYAYKPDPIRLFDEGLEIPVHAAVEAALIKKFKRPERWFVRRT